ncbi:hypothetical protein CSC70_05045 [Pseudoxanthomonas kalamensis DSM 18571]|uniref:DUF4097 family beta strand repeat-containing protein n=1 Tax=Pseudoxanthomonas kalamensis TaxID=289483 RepID=UPI001390B8EE|nr:DUF4097 family beta strand repeat-containing protein [Pseudoxanthomonas kalamensis]KAF1711286.1 hypothetical protein CSC70_05045 [Pseudoxanthomonas kalamensis DSM 18571]
MRIACLSSCLLLALAPSAMAATPINETRPLDADGQVEIENLKGSIQVRACRCEQVEIRGSLGEGVEKLVVEGDGRHLVVKVRYPKNNGWRGDKTEPTRLELIVPLQAGLDIESVSADVDVNGVASRSLSIDSVSGDVVVAAAPHEADIESVSGNLLLTLNTAEISAETVSGNLSLKGRLVGEVDVETVSGNITVQVNPEERVRKFSASTVSGRIRLQTALAENGEIDVETVSGDVGLVLPANLSARVSAETFSGNLKAPGVTVDRPKYGPGASFDTRYGNGDGEIRIETFSGSATLRVE